jgi:hypothetical protein
LVKRKQISNSIFIAFFFNFINQQKVVMKKIYSFAIFLLFAVTAKAQQQGLFFDGLKNSLPLGSAQFTGKVKLFSDSTNLKAFVNNMPNSCLGKNTFEVVTIPNGVATMNAVLVRTIPNRMAVGGQLNVYKLR